MPDSGQTALQQSILTADSNLIPYPTGLILTQKLLVIHNAYPYPKPNPTHPHSETIDHIVDHLSTPQHSEAT